MPGDQWQKLANVRAFLAYMWAHPGKQLLFMGQEFGQPSEWTEERGLDWWILDQPSHAQLQASSATLNRVYRGAVAAVGAGQRRRGVLAARRADVEPERDRVRAPRLRTATRSS